jgi:hypothetical protein
MQNFVPTYALYNIGDHGSEYRGCSYFRVLMGREIRNRPQSEKLHTNRIIDRALPSVQSNHQQRPSIKTLHDYRSTSPGNACSRPLNYYATQLQQPLPTAPQLKSIECSSIQKHICVSSSISTATLQARSVTCPQFKLHLQLALQAFGKQ